MTFASNLRRWLSPQPTPTEAGVEAYFLLDQPAAVQTQQVLAAVDLLSAFSNAAAPLPLAVVHCEPPSAAMREIFDSAPGLRCRHVDYAAIGGDAVLGAALGPYWRHHAALALSRVVQSDFYLVLDATSICIRPLSPRALIEDGRAITAWESASVHADSSATAQALLKAPRMPDPIVSTFPMVLARALANATLDRIESVGGQPAAQCLAKATADGHPWSANALYSCAAGSALNHHHRPMQLNQVTRSLHGDANVWNDAADLTDWDPARWRRLATHGQFLVIQGTDPGRLRRVLSKCYPLVDI